MLLTVYTGVRWNKSKLPQPHHSIIRSFTDLTSAGVNTGAEVWILQWYWSHCVIIILIAIACKLISWSKTKKKACDEAVNSSYEKEDTIRSESLKEMNDSTLLRAGLHSNTILENGGRKHPQCFLFSLPKKSKDTCVSTSVMASQV